MKKAIILIATFLFLQFNVANAQWFGRNKPNYEQFNFQVKESPNFSVYYYVKNDSLVESFIKSSEKWYKHHQKFFQDTLQERNPIILYGDHTDFQQTRIISDLIGVGTGGVTEGLKNRVVMPVMELNSQFDHVLGHELVHVFQYNLLKTGDSISLNHIRNLPLWMVEGMAEYLSIGSFDPNTAMWMRDAVLNDDIPTLKDLTQSNKYFPYRYGHAFWSFVGGVFGDSVVVPLFRETALHGYQNAIKRISGLNEKEFSEAWSTHLKNYYKQFAPAHPDSTLEKDNVVGKLLIDPEKAGKLNIAPVISPNGQYVAFLSNMNLFTVDVHLAEIKTGKIVKTLSSVVKNPQVDDFSYIESAGTWSPLSDRFAFAVLSRGKIKLSIVDMGRHKSLTMEIPGVHYFSNPTWSPDGESIVVSGLVNGQSDLFIFNIKTKDVRQLTEDFYSDIQPQWSNDGQRLIFTSDRPAVGREYDMHALQICSLDLINKQITVLDIFPGSENLNPVFSPGDTSFYFLSNQDGFRNLYQYDIDSRTTYKLTDYYTGISSLTPYSPSLSVSTKTGNLSYVYYGNQTYQIYTASPEDFNKVPLVDGMGNKNAGVLPPYNKQNIPQKINLKEDLSLPDSTIRDTKYRPRFGLTYIGNSGGIGISTGTFGSTALSGGINMAFSDMLGYHNLYAAMAINGEIYDAGGQVAYINQKHKINWGVTLSHIPYRTSSLGYKLDSLSVDNQNYLMENYFVDVYRMFQESAGMFFYFPTSSTRRFELGSSYSYYSFRGERYNNYYYQAIYVNQQKEKIEAPGGYWLGNTYAAYVFDNSHFGIASPQLGRRYRIEASQTYGELHFSTLTLDFRKYFFLNPTSVAFRILHSGIYGGDSEKVYPMSFAYPGLTRGNSLDNIEVYGYNENKPYSINQIFGSRILVANAEWRVSFTGPERLALIKSQYFFSELALFVDAGMAWDSAHNPSFELKPNSTQDRVPFISAGLSYRINFFGQLILEPYYAFPWRGDKFLKGNFGINIVPGW